MRFKRILTAIFCLIMCFIVSINMSGSVFVAQGSKSLAELENEKRAFEQQINNAKSEAKKIEQRINELKNSKAHQEDLKKQLEKQIQNTKQQIKICNDRIISIQNTINALQSEIDAKNNELERTKELFKKRLRSMYMTGTNGKLLILLGSDDFADYLAKTELTRSVSEYDNALMLKITETIKSINQSKDMVEKQRQEQLSLKKTLDQKQQELNSQIDGVNRVIHNISVQTSELNTQKQEYENAIRQAEKQIENVLKQITALKYNGTVGFLWPVQGYYRISSPFGMRLHPITKTYKMHNGIDIAGGGISGKPILAAEDGQVVIASYNAGGYGNYVMINHGQDDSSNTYATLYAHMTRYTVSVGQSVKKGDVIGYVGSTGASTGPHLHFEIRVNGSPKNPMNYYNNVK